MTTGPRMTTQPDGAVRRAMTRPVTIGIKTSPQGVDWATLDAVWARVGEHEVFESVWMNDHLTDIVEDIGGASVEALTGLAALVHRVPGRWVGHAVLSNTFRHPAVLAKAATVLDNATGGRFILGLGAGWHVGEHESLGIPLPPMRERFDRFESAVHVLRALWSDEARQAPGRHPSRPVLPAARRDQRAAAAHARRAAAVARRQPAARDRDHGRAGRWLGDADRQRQHRRADHARRLQRSPGGSRACARGGRARPGARSTSARRSRPGRRPTTVASALGQAREAVERGATHVLLGMRPSLGPATVDAIAGEVAIPLREALGAGVPTA